MYILQAFEAEVISAILKSSLPPELINCHHVALQESDSNALYLKSPTIVSLFTGVVNKSYLPDQVISLNFS